jgi:hypothetical protein
MRAPFVMRAQLERDRRKRLIRTSAARVRSE